MLSYKEGIIPKENVDCLRYQDDVKINDVAKCRRALDHFNGSLASSQAAQKQLNERMTLIRTSFFLFMCHV